MRGRRPIPANGYVPHHDEADFSDLLIGLGSRCKACGNERMLQTPKFPSLLMVQSSADASDRMATHFRLVSRSDLQIDAMSSTPRQFPVTHDSTKVNLSGRPFFSLEGAAEQVIIARSKHATALAEMKGRRSKLISGSRRRRGGKMRSRLMFQQIAIKCAAREI